ncbi:MULTISPECIES: TauD/TfdA family dioxygenase [Pseudomonas]|uniref:TauD/TfdA family dioxygenase n=1 Tax=Pseudomonas quercus TaxID=2722792 RepID=A0ABX0Y8N5_9PSED|nr:MULTISPECIES: TauD/TfdA family dioxygenase [Pseudomonas]MBF7140783.1 TauD/TfdA family dioxygenase [Pseudomonas sp. LY10J]NJO99319.1 TauD/TfdA family dioxygenase [Pseudomonas quercus]
MSVALSSAPQALPVAATALPEQQLSHGGTRLTVLTAPSPEVDLLDPGLHTQINAALARDGGVLLRGFSAMSIQRFHDFAKGFGAPLLSYEFGSTPRSEVEKGVYSSTEYPKHQWIPQHNEQAYTTQWPMKIWFYCDVAPTDRGQTPVADSRAIFRYLDPALRERFEARELMYVRNFGSGLDLPWEQVFNTEDPAQVEAYCREHGIEWEWLEDDCLRIRQRCQAVTRHPQTGEKVWFNQAHLFHISALDAATREALLEIVDEEDLPRNVFYGDGEPIADADLDHVRAVYAAHRLDFPWQQGDVMMLDNMLMTHGRAPFSGDRRVVVAMAQGHSWDKQA